MTTAERVTQIVAEFFAADAGKVTGDTKLDDLGCDSLDRVELAMEIEEEYDIDIVDGAEEGWQTVQQIIDHVVAAVN